MAVHVAHEGAAIGDLVRVRVTAASSNSIAAVPVR
jgi:hypothetical protein